MKKPRMPRIPAPEGVVRGIRSRKAMAVCLALSIVALVLYFVSVARGTFSPGSLLGTAFGIGAAFALFLIMLYSVQRGLPRFRKMGPRRGYMQLHIWGGVLFAILLLAHTGFGVPSGVLTFTLWAVSIWVLVTGAVGLVLQRTIPRILGPTASMEVNLQRVPTLVGELRSRAEAAASRSEPRVKAFYDEEFAAEMAEPRMVGTALLGRPDQDHPRAGALDILRRTLPEDGAATLDELRELRQAKHEMDVHFTLQRILRAWLYLHLPVAIILLGLVVLHVFFVIYY